jgi:hypothetical protein
VPKYEDKLPLYKVTIFLEKDEQMTAGRMISVFREFKDPDLDRIWHILENKCAVKWGRKMNSFDCVMISKRSPDYLKYVRDLQRAKNQLYVSYSSPDHRIRRVNSKQIPVNGKYRNQKD